jgi:hypothetical protein
MRSMTRVLSRAVAIAAFTALTIGGSARLSSADGGMDTGAGGMGYQGTTETLPDATGSGAGGSTDTGTVPDTGSSYRSGTGIDNSGTGINDNSGSGINQGSGTGGAVDTGSGTGGSTSSDTGSHNDDKSTRGSTVGGVTYPDYRESLGTGTNSRDCCW